MINDAVKNAILLGKKMLSTVSPRDEYIVVNIGKSNNLIFTYPSINDIPSSFGYFYDKVPQILEEEGVILAKKKNRWYINQVIQLWKNENPDSLDKVGQEIKLINPGEGFAYYKCRQTSSTRGSSIGPELAGQFAVIIDVKNLRFFLNKYTWSAPYFNIKSGVFKFLGEEMSFSGEKDKKRLDILVNNINCLISKQKFYETTDEKYEIHKQRKSVIQIHDTLRKGFEKIKNNLIKNEKFKKSLVFNSENGFGIFVNNSYFKDETPKKLL